MGDDEVEHVRVYIDEPRGRPIRMSYHVEVTPEAAVQIGKRLIALATHK